MTNASIKTLTLVRVLIEWFEENDWTIEREGDRVVAVMASGYGSGPATVDLTELAKILHEHED